MGKRKFASAFAPVKRAKRSTSSQLVALKRKVSRLSPEVKDHQVSSATFDPTTAAGAIVYVSNIGTGTSDNQRVGKKVVISRIKVRLSIAGLPAAAAAPLYCSVYLIKDAESAGTVPTISGAATSIFTSFDPTTAMEARENKDRFKILNQWHFDQNTAQSDYNILNRAVDYKCNHVLHFSDDSTTQAAAGKNALYLVALTTSDDIDMNFACEFDFTDV